MKITFTKKKFSDWTLYHLKIDIISEESQIQNVQCNMWYGKGVSIWWFHEEGSTELLSTWNIHRSDFDIS